MSVNRTEYVLWGAVLPYPPYEDEEEDDFYALCEPYLSGFFAKTVNNKNDVTIIGRGMGESDRLIVGHVIDRTYGTEGSFSTGPIILPHDASSPFATAQEIEDYNRWEEGIEKCLIEIGLYPLDLDYRWIVLQHFT